jgi:hypothetical protein
MVLKVVVIGVMAGLGGWAGVKSQRKNRDCGG